VFGASHMSHADRLLEPAQPAQQRTFLHTPTQTIDRAAKKLTAERRVVLSLAAAGSYCLKLLSKPLNTACSAFELVRNASTRLFAEVEAALAWPAQRRAFLLGVVQLANAAIGALELARWQWRRNRWRARASSCRLTILLRSTSPNNSLNTLSRSRARFSPLPCKSAKLRRSLASRCSCRVTANLTAATTAAYNHLKIWQ
jgi:hypothetical protein